MGIEADCNKSAVDKSRCMIEAVLTDLRTTYTHTGGGGITDIKLDATNTYTVSIAQEERTDLVTYVLEVKANGTVAILKRTEGTKHRGG